MAILSTAIGVYFLVAPPPAQISHSVMDESDSRDVGLLHNADEHHVLHQADEGEYPSTHDALHSSVRWEQPQTSEDIAGSVAENDAESASRPTSDPTPIAGSSILINDGDTSAAEETTDNYDEKPITNSEREISIPDKPTITDNITSSRTKVAASDVPDRPKAAEKNRPKTVDEKKNKKKSTKKSVGPLFHMVFTTGSTTLSTLNVRSIESVFHANPKGRLHIHQPKVLFHANTTNASTSSTGGNANATLLDETHPRLAPLIEHGYNISFHRYDPADMLRKAVKASIGRGVEVNETAAKAFIASLPKLRRQEFWYSNESNLLRLALLYVQGGTYMDTDVIVLRSHDEPFAGGGGGSGAVKENRDASAMEPLPKDGAIAAPENNVIPFPKPHHPFIAAALNNFMRHFNGTVWGNNGPRVLKRTAWERPDLLCEGEIKDKVFASWEKQLKEEPMADMEPKPGSSKNERGKDVSRCVTILDKKVIQPIGWKRWFDYCISPKKSPTGSKAEALLERAYASHLNNKLTGGLFDDQHEGSDRQTYVVGSACDLLMNKYCTVCS